MKNFCIHKLPVENLGGALVYTKKDGNILFALVHDVFGYWTLSKGGVDEGETPEQTAIREIKEETNLDAEIDYLLFEFESDVFKRHESFFVMKNIKGKEKIGEPEISWENESNKYKLEWIELAKLSEINLLPQEIKKVIVEKYC